MPQTRPDLDKSISYLKVIRLFFLDLLIYQYDKNIETVAGFGYENCCFAFNLTASDKNFTRYNQANSDMNYLYINEAWDNIIEIENKSRINFEFKLKGFNSSFDKNRNLFNNSLFNY